MISRKLGNPVECRVCGAPICFIKTVKGKTMPVDPEPVYFFPGEGDELLVQTDGTVQRGREPRANDIETKEAQIGYRSHFATCPGAEVMRGTGRHGHGNH